MRRSMLRRVQAEPLLKIFLPCSALLLYKL